ncbi:MAG: two-component system, cell cycle sensor histidine kinase and response regulator CckA [Solirubrobacteraceae bacterium]|jgi:PAS domain S-box-containing protein|nr:two-component system, cell cycle sensor histidine kinase and response regulator CckA [Solirubrobacteraceae bacterium]
MSADGLHEGALVGLLDAAPDGILLVAGDGRVAFSNQAAQRLFGYSREGMLDATIESLVPARFRARHVPDRRAYAADPRQRPMGLGLQLQGLCSDGSEVPVEISLAPMSTGGERMIVTIVRDATQRSAIAEQRLRFARSQAVEEVVSGLEAIVWESTTPDRESLSYLGGREEALLGYPHERWLQEGFWLSLVYPEDRIHALTLAATAQEKDTFELEYRLIDASGDLHQVRDIVSVSRDENGDVVRLRGVIVDMTDRRELEARLAQAQKMEAVGQLAGGIAHDFNNLLTIASGYTQRLRGRADLAGAHEDLDQIIAATDRAAELIRQLLTFARRGEGEAVLLDPSAAIRGLEPMLRRLIDADIVFDFRLEPNSPHVLIDRAELEQILMNLIINARDAMSSGGTLTVSSGACTISAAEAARHHAPAGDYVQLCFADTGVGIPEEMRDRIFEPFFTTKQDKGTGMGLATVYGIIDHAGGWIDVASTLGAGSTFRIVLPIGAPVQAQRALHESPTASTLLLVEDEAALRKLVVMMLEEAGHVVLQAGNGLDAIAISEHHRGRIDLLITDVVMPRLSGPELAQRLRGLRPGLDVLFMSGYNDSRLVSRGVAEAQVELLVKPFTADQLIGRVRELTSAAGVV